MSLADLTPAQKEDLVASLAVLVAHDSGVAVNKETLDAIVGASGNSIAAYWGALFSKFLEGKELDDILLKPGMGGGPAPAAGAAAAGGAAAAEEPEEEEEEEEEESVGGAGGLFGDSDSSS